MSSKDNLREQIRQSVHKSNLPLSEDGEILLLRLIMPHIEQYGLEQRIDERKLVIGEWNAASAKDGDAYNKRLYAIAKASEGRIRELERKKDGDVQA